MKAKTVIKKAKKEFIIKYFFSIILRLGAVLSPLILSIIVDSSTNLEFKRAYLYIIFLVFITIILKITEVLNTHSWHKLYNKIYQVLTETGLQSIDDNSMYSLSRFNNSQFINIFNNDINIMSDFYCASVIRSVRVIEFIVIIIYFFIINLIVGIVGFFMSIIILILLYFSNNKIEKVNQIKSAELDKKTNVLTEIFVCIKEIKNFNLFSKIKKRGLNYSDNYISSVLKQRVVEDTFKYSIVLIIDLCRLVLIFYGVYLISQGQMTIGALLIIYNYYSQLIEGFTEFISFNINFRQFKVAQGRYNRLLKYSINKNEIEKITNLDLKGDIQFKNILYGYRNDPILKRVSVNFKPTSFNIITGPQRSGKSGFFDLLLKLNRQHEGELTIDGIDINDFEQDYYLKNISLVAKDPIFFNMSITNNLSMITGDFRKIVRICQDLGIHEEIIKLKDGYDTVINPAADELSSNIKYLLGVARVLIKNPKIMLFDETFNNLEQKYKINTLNLLEKCKENHTIILITTDKLFLEKADKIVVVNDHQIEIEGTHQSLQKNKTYKSILNN